MGNTPKSLSSGRTRWRLMHLFVLFTIIALLIAYLVPVIERVREKSNLALCKDNLRMIGASLKMYANASGGYLPISPTVENPHVELIDGLEAGQFTGDPRRFYCPSERRPSLSFSDQNFKSGVIGYYYYCALTASTDAGLSKFLRGGVAWPRKLNTAMDPKSWVMSDNWMSGLPTAHPGYRKGVNYLMLDGSVDFVVESPRKQFH